MNAPPRPQVSFQLFIIESMDLSSTVTGKEEGPLLEKAAQLSGLQCSSWRAFNRSQLQSYLYLVQLWPLSSQTVPILHIGCHGDQHGIGLMSGEQVSWNDLASWLRPINAARNETLI